MNKIDPRDAWQEIAIEKWYNEGKCRSSIEAATATGKSYVGKKVIERLNAKLPGKAIDIVVPSRYLKKQWEEEYVQKFGLKNAEVFVINTYAKMISDRTPHLLLLDEIHNYAAPTFKTITRSCAPFVLGLTATMERKDGLHLILQRFAPVVYKLPMAEAKKMGIVADYEIYNLGIEIGQQDQRLYERMNMIFNERFKRFSYDFDLAMRCSFKGQDMVRSNVARMNSTKEIQFTAKDVYKWAHQWAWAMRERKRFFYHAPSKVRVVKEIYEKYQVPTIVFSEGTRFADSVADAIGPDCRAYHTQLVTQIRQKRKNGKYVKYKMGAKKLRDEALDLFNEGKIGCLSTARALNEGFSVNGVEIAILASYTSDIRTFVQRMGRAVRFLPNKQAKIIALYLKSFQNSRGEEIKSQEEKWLRQSQRNQTSVRWIDSLEQIESYNKILF